MTSRHFMNLYNLFKEFSNCYWVVAGWDPWLNKIWTTLKKTLGKCSYRFSEVAGMCSAGIKSHWHIHLYINVQFEAKSFQLAWLTTAPFCGWVREPEKIIFVSSLQKDPLCRGEAVNRGSWCWDEAHPDTPMVWGHCSASPQLQHLLHWCDCHRAGLWSSRQHCNGSWQQIPSCTVLFPPPPQILKGCSHK